MIARSLYRTLVPDAPPHRRTETDERGPEASVRSAAIREVQPGLQSPRLVSSYAGSIDRILFCFPMWASEHPSLVAGYLSVLEALRPGTQFVVAQNTSAQPTIEEWFTKAGHSLSNVEFTPLPDFIMLTDWAEDAYVSLKDDADGSDYLMEPWEFGRWGDALIADAVEEYTGIRVSSSPLIFQGGNCLVGDDFWLLGTDYIADTVALVTRDRAPAPVPPGDDPRQWAAALFRQYVDARRTLTPIGTRRPIPLREFRGTREGDTFLLDLAMEGVGTFQPIFHIDMFVTLVGRDADGAFQVLVGSPALADELLGTRSPYALADVYDGIAEDLRRSGFAVRRNPLVHLPSPGASHHLSALREFAKGDDRLVPAIDELVAAGGQEDTPVQARTWHHVTWNNCLVENSTSVGRHVYLPTYGHGARAALGVVDEAMGALWEELGFTPHLLGDFNDFAERQGVVHCIKKYLTRGD